MCSLHDKGRKKETKVHEFHEKKRDQSCVHNNDAADDEPSVLFVLFSDDFCVASLFLLILNHSHSRVRHEGCMSCLCIRVKD